jgi:hypothetical protein
VLTVADQLADPAPDYVREWCELIPQSLLLDRRLPIWDVTRVERRVIDAPQGTVYNAVLQVDFLDAIRNNRAVRVLVALRTAAERLVAALRLRRFEQAPPQEALRLRDIAERGEWISLGTNPPTEVVFGAIGRFWSGETRWIASDASEFSAFDRPGFAKIACNIHLRALAGGRTLVTYEARTKATDPASRRAFLRYWRVVAPFVGVVMRSLLDTVDAAAAG